MVHKLGRTEVYHLSNIPFLERKRKRKGKKGERKGKERGQPPLFVKDYRK